MDGAGYCQILNSNCVPISDFSSHSACHPTYGQELQGNYPQGGTQKTDLLHRRFTLTSILFRIRWTSQFSQLKHYTQEKPWHTMCQMCFLARISMPCTWIHKIPNPLCGSTVVLCQHNIELGPLFKVHWKNKQTKKKIVYIAAGWSLNAVGLHLFLIP